MSTIISFIPWLSVCDVKLYTDEKKQLCSICLWIRIYWHCTVIFCICWIYSNEANYGIIKGDTGPNCHLVLSLLYFHVRDRPISVSLTFDIHWQAPDHKTGWSLCCTSHLTSCPRLTYLHWRAQVWAVKTFMKLCLLEQPQHYSDKSLRSVIHIRAHTALLTITTQNTVRSQEWNSAKWIPLSPDRMKLSHDVGLRTHSFKVMIWKRNPCCHETRDTVANRLYWCCCHWWRRGHAIRGELIHFTSLRYRFHHCRDGSRGTLHAMHT